MLRIVLALLSMAYPFLWYWGRDNGAFVYLALGMGVLWLFRAWQSPTWGSRLMALVVALFFAAVCMLRQPQAMYWYPVGVSLLMLLVFGGSLWAKQTVIERLARLRQPNLPLAAVVYTRKVTQVWCAFFILNAVICGGLVWAQAWSAWAFYTGVVAYLLMGLLLAGEWLYRHWVVLKDTNE